MPISDIPDSLPELATVQRIEGFAAALERRVTLALARVPGGAALKGEALGRWLAKQGPWFDPAEERAMVGAERLDAYASPGRLVYRLNDRKMVKVAFHQEGRDANRREAELSLDPAVAPWVLAVVARSFRDNWVVMPLARPLRDEEAPRPGPLPDPLRRAVGDEPDRRRWAVTGIPRLAIYGDEPQASGAWARLMSFLRGATG